MSANTELRERLSPRVQCLGKAFLAPVKPIYTGDNAAMIGILAYYQAQKGK